MNTKQMDSQYVANTYKRFPVEIVKGENCTLHDDTGKEYIDLTSGIAVNSFGVNDESWKDAVIEQLNQVQHTSNLYYTAPQAKLAQLLCEKTGMKKVFFGNSGAEANECAIKAARKYASDKYGENAHPVIITLKNSFHGRTVTTLSATGQESFHHHFGPFTPGFAYAQENDLADMERLIGENSVCAVMMELVQGESGVNPLDKGYVQAVAGLCAEKDILLVIDEVQTGNGRTGTLYAYEQYGIEPDILSTAKGLGGGLPIGACLLGEKVENTLSAGMHGSTFGGNPVCAAGALAIMKRIDAALMKSVNEKHDKIVSALSGLDGVKSITGLGLMIGILPVKPVAEIIAACLQKGVMVLSAHDKLRLLPALSITDEELDKALTILKEVLA